jgi:hypothetical protein
MKKFARALLLFLCIAGAAHAQADEATKSAARTLGEDGLRLWEQHDYAGALTKFNQAEALFPVPTLGLRAGQCLEKLGRIVEASERYLRTSMLTIDSTAPAAYQEGQNATKQEALRLRDGLLPRIAHVRLNVTGKPDALLVDGKSYPLGLLRAPIPIDPGAHKIAIRSGVEEATGEVTLAEGEEKGLDLALSNVESTPAPPPPPPVVLPAPAPEKPKPAPSPFPFRTVGIVSMAAGGAAIGVGVITWAIGLGEANSLEAMCPNHVCPNTPDIGSRLSSYDTMRTASMVTFVSGAIVAGAGVALVLLAPKRAPKVSGGLTQSLVWSW